MLDLIIVKQVNFHFYQNATSVKLRMSLIVDKSINQHFYFVN